MANYQFNDLFYYQDGLIFNRLNRGKALKDGRAGYKDDRGRFRVIVNGKKHYVSRVIYEMFNGVIDSDLVVRHKNGDSTDNRIENLVAVDKRYHDLNPVMAKGYSWNKNINKYQSYIVRNGKRYHLGFYEKEDNARKAYLKAKSELDA